MFSQVSGEFDYRDVFPEVSGNMEEESALILSREKLTSSSISRFKTELPFSLYISERQINNTGRDLSALEDHRIEDLKLMRPNLSVLRELSTGSEVLVLCDPDGVIRSSDDLSLLLTKYDSLCETIIDKHAPELFQVVNRLTGRAKDEQQSYPVAPPGSSVAEMFSNHFYEKVKNIRDAFDTNQSDVAADVLELNDCRSVTSKLSAFKPVSVTDMENIISSAKPTTCS